MRNLVSKVIAAFLLICGGALPGAVVLADGAPHKVVIQVSTDDERTDLALTIGCEPRCKDRTEPESADNQQT